MLAHAKPGHLGTLLEALEHPDNHTVVHVDARADLVAFRRAAPGNVEWVPNRVPVFHHGWQSVDATFRALQLVRHRSPPADYYVLLSGDSYPLRSQDYIRDYLAARPGVEWINALPLPAPQVRKGLEKLADYYPRHDPRGSRLRLAAAKTVRRLHPARNYRTALGDLQPWCGSAWWALSHDAIERVEQQVVQRREFVRFCRHTQTPDEHFFQILLASDPEFRQRMRPGLMYVDFSILPGPAEISHRHLRELAATRSRTDAYGEHEELLFARKFGENPAIVGATQELWDREERAQGER